MQYAPYELADGTWDDQREAFGDAVVAAVARYAPDLPSKILHRQVLTPLDIERRFGLSEGNIFQGELLLEQLFANRPLPGGGYRTPVAGLWMCGSSTHPGGAISGAPGRNAAMEVLKVCGLATGDGARMSWDAIVVGAGHNALVCACYLARDGLRVLVLEKRERVGGMADTTDLMPGVRVPTLAHTVGRLRPAVARELQTVQPRAPTGPAGRAAVRAATRWRGADVVGQRGAHGGRDGGGQAHGRR